MNQKLLDILLKALQENNASEFTYAWEWEVSLLPDHFLTINGQDILMEYKIDFDFGELDLDRLAAAGHFHKNVLVNTDTEAIISYQLIPAERH
jgi:hypothetical protein